jgi:hypothetical protein
MSRTDDLIITADVAAARQRAVAGIRDRVTATSGSWLGSSECLQVAIACAARDSDELLGVLFAPKIARDALARKKHLSITEHEWNDLFGATSHATRDASLPALNAQPLFRETVRKLGIALRCTVCESTQSKMWERTWTKAACYVSLHMEPCEELIALSIGGVVRADSRRLEDMRAEQEDLGIDSLLVSQAIVTLAETAT